MTMPSLDWLPECHAFRDRLRAARTLVGEAAWHELVALANHRLDFVQTGALDAAARALAPDGEAVAGPIRDIRLALLGSSTVAHLQPALRVAGLRRGLRFVVHETEYGLYRHELFDRNSSLHAFRPEIVLFALDARHLAAGVSPGFSAEEAERECDRTTARLVECWREARRVFRASVLQQAVLPVFPELLGSNEHRLPGSRAAFVGRLNERIRSLADAEGAHVVGVDRAASRHGIDRWHDAAIWHQAKQEIAIPAAPMYGELAARLVGALAGRSAKCLVLDLDNTLWGGVIGDDGLEGIVLGQGSAAGEGFAAVQRYALELSDRGVILAVCSKNDESVALRAFAEHPEMVLKRERIASFVANWTDKAANLRRIAAELNIGLDSLVFLDDNRFERNLVRGELPMVAVPEVPEDPALVPQRLADAGYFEAVAITDDDRARTRQYQVNRERRDLQTSATDMESYLRGLDMRLVWRRFDAVGLQRIVQLVNKTNQFNLTTRRTTDEEILAVIGDPDAIGLQFRLIDRFDDNGMIAVVIGRKEEHDLRLHTWLMSCRVLGRQVEQATLDVVVAHARRAGCARLVGEYIPSAKNGMVADHYARLGFAALGEREGIQHNALAVADYRRPDIFMDIEEG